MFSIFLLFAKNAVHLLALRRLNFDKRRNTNWLGVNSVIRHISNLFSVFNLRGITLRIRTRRFVICELFLRRKFISLIRSIIWRCRWSVVVHLFFFYYNISLFCSIRFTLLHGSTISSLFRIRVLRFIWRITSRIGWFFLFIFLHGLCS